MMPSETGASGARRFLYLDFLRALACFLVIVNHTNSYVFKAEIPGTFLWGVSIGWYYVSKIAVPLFVMVSGACLLPRQDSYRRAFQRFLRMLGALLLFSYGYYLWNLWQTGWVWSRALNLPGFLKLIWRERITDSFWYLYFYMGLLLMMPFLQRLAKGMDRRDIGVFLGLSFGLNALWPLTAHYAPGLTLPQYFDFPLFQVFIGLLFAGHFLHAHARPRRGWALAGGGVLLLCVLLSVRLTALEASRLPPGEKYWFMDERTAPALPVILSALSVTYLAKTAFALREEKRPLSPRITRGITFLGAAAFPVYLLQDWLTVQTRYRVFAPLCGIMNPFLAALLWEAGIFLALLPVAWLLRRLPGIRKIV